MIHPLLPYAMRGAIWYQGEVDAGRAREYASRFPAMITAWRSHFGQGDLPFLWMQLEGSRAAGKPGAGAWAAFREAQSQALSLPSTGEAVAIDLGSPSGLTPAQRREAGRRLALIAKANAYSIEDDYSGPAYSGIDVGGPSVRVHFRFAGQGLTAAGRPLQSFEAAGADRVFHAATAVIDGDTVVVRAAAVKLPVAVRYAWADAPDANLFNGAGLPAAPFRSDNW
jgi:sialate O-acetylesterase